MFNPSESATNDFTLRPKGILLFTGLATLVIAVVAGLAMTQLMGGNLQIKPSIQTTPSYWHQFVAVSGLIVPLLVRILWRKHPLVRHIFNAYLLVLAAQVITELLLVAQLTNDLIAIVGVLYSSFRLAQLWQAQQLAADSKEVSPWLRFLLFFLLGIWAINLLWLILF